MANIRKRGKKYHVQVRRNGFSPASRSFTLRADAEEWARFMETRADRGDLPASYKALGNYRLRDIIERYRDEVSVKKKSYNSEVYIINAFLREKLADVVLSNLVTSDFSEYRARRLESVKAGTVNRELSIIKHALDIAAREWDIPLFNNPLANLKKLKVNNARDRRLSDDEYQALMAAILETRNPHIEPLMNFAIETGMRRGEILALKWKDVNKAKRILHIPEAKNGHSRTIPLSKGALSVIDAMEGIDSKRVFPLTSDSVKMAWKRLVARAGVKDLHFHDLRHEAISRFFEKGLSVAEVALISGHRDFRMLFRYTHLKAEDLAKKL